MTFSYKQLKKSIERCLSRVKKLCPKATKKEMLELKGYMRKFIRDVESDKEVNQYMKVKETPADMLPTLLGEITEEKAREFLEQRLKGDIG